MESSYLVLSFSPLPAELIKTLLSPYRGMLDRDIEVIVFRNLGDRASLFSLLEKADVIIGDYTMTIPITRDMCNAMKKPDS